MNDNYKHPIEEKKVKFRSNRLSSKKESTSWIFIIAIISFFVSASLLFVSSKALRIVDNVIVSFCLVLLIIVIGIIFDVIGIATTAADEAPFHAMASRKRYGARQAIMLIRNANKVSTLCNDVVGDICGIISGSASAIIILRISHSNGDAETSLAGLVISGIVASVTVGGKAMGKTIAIENSNYIVYKVGVLVKFIFGRFNFNNLDKKNKRRNT